MKYTTVIALLAVGMVAGAGLAQFEWHWVFGHGQTTHTVYVGNHDGEEFAKGYQQGFCSGLDTVAMLSQEATLARDPELPDSYCAELVEDFGEEVVFE